MPRVWRVCGMGLHLAMESGKTSRGIAFEPEFQKMKMERKKNRMVFTMDVVLVLWSKPTWTEHQIFCQAASQRLNVQRA